MNVLIVDDSPTTVGILKQQLTQLGHTVVGTVSTGRDAVNAYASKRPDVVTMDIVMPDMDGIEATRQIVAGDPDAVIVIVTSHDRMTMVTKALAAGARGYIAQPIDPYALSEMVRMTQHSRVKIERGSLEWEEDRPNRRRGDEPRKPARTGALRTLIVEDSPISQTLLRKLLGELGHDVVGVAKTGREAWTAYKTLKPDLVTMDIVMPDMDGIEATREIVRQFPDAVIVMVTAQGRETMVVKALAAGARGYMVQPVDKEKLREVIGLSQKFRAKMVNGHLTWEGR